MAPAKSTAPHSPQSATFSIHPPSSSKSSSGPKQRSATKSLGSAGEDAAAEHLQSLGYHIIARNWVCRRKEMDIIALGPADSAYRQLSSSPLLIFVEVKSRLESAKARTHIFDNVTPKKQSTLRLLACTYIRQNRRLLSTLVQGWPPAFRIDIIGLVLRPETDGKPPQVVSLEHLKGPV